MTLGDPYLFRPSRERLWQVLAQSVIADAACLDLLRANIERSQAHGRLQSTPLLEWRRRIERAKGSGIELAALVAWMQVPNHDSKPLESCSPFPRSLTDEDLEALGEST